MGEGPEKNPRSICLKNKCFARIGGRVDAAIEVYRGVFQSLRPTYPGRFAVNVDVANTCFRPVENRPDATSAHPHAPGVFTSKGEMSMSLENTIVNK